MSTSQAAPSLRRLTSSGRHPKLGVPYPKRVVTRRHRAAAAVIIGPSAGGTWRAGVRKVETCTLAEYDNGRGLRTVFESGGAEKKGCSILCEGNSQGLTMSLRLSHQHPDPSPTILHTFTLPDEANKIGVRLYDASVSMELREQPVEPKARKSKRRAPVASGNCWVVHLDVALKPESVLVRSKTMLRRVESTTNVMPVEWFSYRNYFVQHRPGSTVPSSQVEFGDALTHTFIGGYPWRFTGHLASEAFRNALGWDAVEQVHRTDAEMGPGQVTTRLREAAAKTAKGKKAAKRAPAKARRVQRVQTRSRGLVPDTSSEEVQAEEDVSEDAGSVNDDESDFPIEGLLEERVRRSKTQYKVQWSGDFEPTWEPAENVTAELIADFEQKKALKLGEQAEPLTKKSATKKPTQKGNRKK